MFKFKKIKFCFKTSDYEGQSLVDKIFIILDKSRGYYGIKFCTDSNTIKYGSVICTNSGVEYDSHYYDRTFYDWCIYHFHPTWNTRYAFSSHTRYGMKARVFDFNKYIVRKPLECTNEIKA